jgi:murein DD-endopeptidase MepM/ murein hydrolase activator NlpD
MIDAPRSVADVRTIGRHDGDARTLAFPLLNECILEVVHTMAHMNGNPARGRARIRWAWKAVGLLIVSYALALATGEAGGGSRIPAESASIAPVVPGGRLGEYRHGTFPSRGKRTHAGVDIVAPCGTPVRAVEEGRIVDRIRTRSDPDFSSLGYMAIVEHPASVTGRVFYSLYLHLQSPPQPDEHVARGQELGRVGVTGRTTGCHLHLEIRYFRGRVSPRWKNIYGPGDQRESSYFRDNWEDPVAFIARLPGEPTAASGVPDRTSALRPRRLDAS